jgi:hypothetical protein
MDTAANILVTPSHFNNSLAANRGDYWSRRRQWWRAESARRGTDWRGIFQSMRTVAAYRASWVAA